MKKNSSPWKLREWNFMWKLNETTTTNIRHRNILNIYVIICDKYSLVFSNCLQKVSYSVHRLSWEKFVEDKINSTGLLSSLVWKRRDCFQFFNSLLYTPHTYRRPAHICRVKKNRERVNVQHHATKGYPTGASSRRIQRNEVSDNWSTIR